MNDLVLINNSYLENLSVRYLSSALQAKGYGVRTIHCEARKNEVFELLSRASLETLTASCREARWVGISLLTTHQLNRSRQIHAFLKSRVKAKIIWGGVPVICDPEFYLGYSDYVCLGEGEQVLEDLLRAKDLFSIQGLGFRSADGGTQLNALPDLLDLNRAPLPLFDLKHGFFLKDGALVSVLEGMKNVHQSYSLLSIRGCPYQCSYCLNSSLKNIFAGKGSSLRFVNPERVIDELLWVKHNLLEIKRVIFDDDDFFLRSEPEVQHLLQLYAEHVDLPIFYLQTHIQNISEGKVDALLQNGIKLHYLKIGLQSGSQRINKEVFDRNFQPDRFLQTLKMLNSKGVRVMLDVISSNPYATEADSYASLVFYGDLFRQTKRLDAGGIPLKIYDHKLMFYPGSKLFARAQADGVIEEDYLEGVLLQRNTRRELKEDIDLESLLVALVNRALRSETRVNLASILLAALRFRPLFSLISRLKIVSRLYQTTGFDLVARLSKG